MTTYYFRAAAIANDRRSCMSDKHAVKPMSTAIQCQVHDLTETNAA